MVGLLVSTLALGGECSDAHLDASVATALAAAVEPEATAEAFRAARDQANDLLLCLSEPIRRPSAARYHFLRAVDAFSQGNLDGTALALRSVVAIRPAFSLDSATWPLGHPFHAMLERAREQPIVYRVVRPLLRGQRYFDGVRLADDEAPADRPVIAQWIDEDRIETRYLAPNAILADLRPSPTAPWSGLATRWHLVTGAGLAWGEALQDGARVQPSPVFHVPLEVAFGFDTARAWIRGQLDLVAPLGGPYLYTGPTAQVRATRLGGAIAVASGILVGTRGRIGGLAGAQFPSRMIGRLVVGSDIGSKLTLELRPGVNVTTVGKVEPALLIAFGLIALD